MFKPKLSKTMQAELRDTLERGGCPLCRLAARAEESFLNSLTYERILDFGTREELKHSRGMCLRHARAWREVHGCALGVAIVYENVIKDLLGDTELEFESSLKFWETRATPTQLAEELAPSATCPACQVGADAAARFANVLLQDIHQEHIRTALEQAGGLCLPHLRLTLALRGSTESKRLLLEVERQAWTALRAELQEFIRKNDYRFRDEPKGSERDSWLRAMDALVGLNLDRVA
ncbi:MAG: DUF6062 family protein [Chloroflexota bacterium]|nr:DUF6062 family protein [Chloroflexota bacterium]